MIIFFIVRATIIEKYGDIESIAVKDIDSPKTMSRDDVFIQHIALNISPDDVMLCDGRTFLSEDQKQGIEIPGLSGVARVIKKGSNIKHFDIGQQVGYMIGPPGSNVEKRVVHNSLLLNAPSDISIEKLAVCFREIMTAYIMMYKAVKITKGSFVMVNGIDGGIGHIIAQWCRFSGLKVIGIVTKDSKKAFASRFCDVIISQESGDIFEETKMATDSQGVNIVFDGIGESVFDVSLRCLQFGGTYLNYFSTSGLMNTIDVSRFSSKSIFFGRPRLEHYQINKAQMVLTMKGIFDIIRKGGIDIVTTTYTLDNIKSAYLDVKNGNTNGSVVVVV